MSGSISVEPGLVRRLLRHEDGDVDFVVRTSSDREQVKAAVDEAIAAIAERAALDPELKGVTFSTGAISLPSGVYVRVDAELSGDLLRDVPKMIVDALERHGVRDALVGTPRSVVAPLGWVDEADRAVTLFAFPEQRLLPASWEQRAVSCLLESPDTAPRLFGWFHLGTWLDVDGVDGFAAMARHAREHVIFVKGDPRSRGVSLDLDYGRLAPGLRLTIGGLGLAEEELIQAFDGLTTLARALAPEAGHVLVDIRPSWPGTGHGYYWPWRAPLSLVREEMPWQQAAQYPDLLVPDACAFQVLGPAHLSRARRRLRPELLPRGRGAVACGTPSDWIGPWVKWEVARSEARKTLDGVVLSRRRAQRIVARRRREPLPSSRGRAAPEA